MGKKFKLNEVYSNKDIYETFGGNRQSGIRYRKDDTVIVLISNSMSNKFYNDNWGKKYEEITFCGQGRIGDQRMEGANKKLNNSIKTNDKIFIFEKLKKGEYTYRGQFELKKEAYTAKYPDINCNDRTVFQFDLKRK